MATLGVAAAAMGRCVLKPVTVFRFPGPARTVYVNGVPVVVSSEIRVQLRANVSTSAPLASEITTSLGGNLQIGWQAGAGFSHSSDLSPRFTPGSSAPDANADSAVSLVSTISVGLYGVERSNVQLGDGADLNADTVDAPWWRLVAPISAAGRLTVPGLGLSSSRIDLYRHAFLVARAPGAFTSPNQTGTATTTTPGSAAPLPTVPAAGPTLVDEEATAADPSTGDESFTDWSRATGQPAGTVVSLPSSLSGYRCVVLDLDTSFVAGDGSELAGFLKAGGTIVALGERSDGGGPYDQADTAINGLLSSLGSGLSLNAASVDEGDTVTSNISSSAATQGVSVFAYNWATTVGLAGGAVPLIATPSGSGVLVGMARVGAGTVIASGDSNAFSDNNDGFYGDYDNGQLVKNICP